MFTQKLHTRCAHTAAEPCDTEWLIAFIPWSLVWLESFVHVPCKYWILDAVYEGKLWCTTAQSCQFCNRIQPNKEDSNINRTISIVWASIRAANRGLSSRSLLNLTKSSPSKYIIKTLIFCEIHPKELSEFFYSMFRTRMQSKNVKFLLKHLAL